jgi:hypothetical protein
MILAPKSSEWFWLLEGALALKDLQDWYQTFAWQGRFLLVTNTSAENAEKNLKFESHSRYMTDSPQGKVNSNL